MEAGIVGVASGFAVRRRVVLVGVHDVAADRIAEAAAAVGNGHVAKAGNDGEGEAGTAADEILSALVVGRVTGSGVADGVIADSQQVKRRDLNAAVQRARGRWLERL